ncbi:MAG: hypothetical protein M3R24_03425 [Chloroflexota bacterium]|nr:hypothetical protein [Chloroflexota bacterium]
MATRRSTNRRGTRLQPRRRFPRKGPAARRRFANRLVMGDRLNTIGLWWVIGHLRASYRQAYYLRRWLDREQKAWERRGYSFALNDVRDALEQRRITTK